MTEWHAYSYGNFVSDSKYEGAFNKGVLTVSRPEYTNCLRWYLLSVSSKKKDVICLPSKLNASVTSTLTTFTVQISTELLSYIPANGDTLYLIQKDASDSSIPHMTKCTLSGKTDHTTYWQYTATYVEGDEATYDPASATLPSFACELNVYGGECKFVYVEGKGYLPTDVGAITGTPFEDGITFSWDKIADHDCKGYMVRTGVQWEEGTVYAVNDLVVPSTANNHIYKCTTPGTSDAATEPSWPTGVGDTVGDGAGALVWTECAADWIWQFVNITQFNAELTHRQKLIQNRGDAVIHIQVQSIDFSNLLSASITNGHATRSVWIDVTDQLFQLIATSDGTGNTAVLYDGDISGASGGVLI